MRLTLCATLVMLSLLQQAPPPPAPIADYHQHLFSPAAGALVTGNKDSAGISAREVIALLDAAGIPLHALRTPVPPQTDSRKPAPGLGYGLAPP